MVDTRLRGEWLHNPTFDDLSHEAWRLLTLAMMWSNQQGTDGRVPTRYIRLLHPDVGPSVVTELENAGLLERTADEVRLLGWDGDLGQSSAEYVTRKRDEARERMRTIRQSRSTSAAGEPANVRANVPTDVGQARSTSVETSPEAYIPTNVRTNERCPKHPDGDTGEPCKQCQAIREAKLTRPTPTRRSPTPDDGHQHRFIGRDGDCTLCGLIPSRDVA